MRLVNIQKLCVNTQGMIFHSDNGSMSKNIKNKKKESNLPVFMSFNNIFTILLHKIM